MQEIPSVTPEELVRLAEEARKPLTPAETEQKLDNIRKSKIGEEILRLGNSYREARAYWLATQLFKLLPVAHREWLSQGDEGWKKVRDWLGIQGFRVEQHDDLTCTIKHGTKTLATFKANLAPHKDEAAQK